MDKNVWGQRPGQYSLIIRQKNKVKGYELYYYTEENMWGTVLGFYKTKQEAVSAINMHKGGLK